MNRIKNYFLKRQHREEVIQAFINIIKEISFNEDKIRSSDYIQFICQHHYGAYKDYLAVQLYGTPNQIRKIEDLFLHLERKNIQSIKYFMKELVNEVRSFYGLEEINECVFFSPNLLDKSIKEKIKRLTTP